MSSGKKPGKREKPTGQGRPEHARLVLTEQHCHTARTMSSSAVDHHTIVKVRARGPSYSTYAHAHDSQCPTAVGGSLYVCGSVGALRLVHVRI